MLYRDRGIASDVTTLKSAVFTSGANVTELSKLALKSVSFVLVSLGG